MRLPRGVSGQELAEHLAGLGYRPIRQAGSHLRLLREGSPDHRITIPMHKDLRVGTLNRILSNVADHLDVKKADVVRQLWDGQ